MLVEVKMCVSLNGTVCPAETFLFYCIYLRLLIPLYFLFESSTDITSCTSYTASPRTFHFRLKTFVMSFLLCQFPHVLIFTQQMEAQPLLWINKPLTLVSSCLSVCLSVLSLCLTFFLFSDSSRNIPNHRTHSLSSSQPSNSWLEDMRFKSPLGDNNVFRGQQSPQTGSPTYTTGI